jgi:hypothetical protein
MFAYAALPPIENADLVEEQLRRAVVYRNNLVENERRRREQVQEVRRQLFPDLAEMERTLQQLDEEIAVLRTAMKATNAQRRRRVQPSEQVTALAELRLRQRTLRDACRAERDRTKEDPALLASWQVIEENAQAEVRRLRGTCGLAWGTYLVVEASVPHAGDPPRFQRYDGTGRLAVQIQATKPLTTDSVRGDRDQRLQVTELPRKTDAIRHVADGQRAGHKLLYRWGASDVAVRFRVGSDENRRPIWATFPVILHRPLPPGADVKWVYFIRRKMATSYRWQVVFVLSQDEWLAKQPAGVTGAAGLDVGWRKVEDGLRVAVWQGTDGRQGEIVIPQYRLDRWREVTEIQSARDLDFNAAKQTLQYHLRSTANVLPEWMREQAATLAQWRSPARLAGYVLRWRDERHAGDEVVFASLNDWRKRDKQAYQHQERLSARNQRWRDHFYREQLQALGSAYQRLFVERLNVSEMRRTPLPEEVNEVVVRHRNAAANGRLLALAGEIFEKNVGRVPAAGTTLRHAGCGYVNRGIDKGPQWLLCEQCGVEFDQDYNAAANLLAAGLSGEDTGNAARTA